MEQIPKEPTSISYLNLLNDIFFNTGFTYEEPTIEQIQEVDRVLQIEFNPKWKQAVMMRYSSEGKAKLKDIAEAIGGQSEETARQWVAKGISYMRNQMNWDLFPFKDDQ